MLCGMQAAAFRNAKPFPVAVIDNFLPEEFAIGLNKEITELQDVSQSNDYIFAKNKFEYPALEKIGPFGSELKRFFLSENFERALSEMYGVTLFLDKNFTGGGVHRGGTGSFLDMHADFERHPRERNWVRELNILLYMNKDWVPSYGGSLDLKNSNTGETKSIDPIFNRCVLMLTKLHTLHGYRPTNFPVGSFRSSVAAYAYSLESDEERLAKLSTTTSWQPADASAVKRVLAAIAPKLVKFKQRVFGSNTVKNSDRGEEQI